MLEMVDAVKQTIPDASNRPPGAVLEHVLDALRQAEARHVVYDRWLRTKR